MPILNTSSSDCDVVSSSCCSTFSASDDDDTQLTSSITAGSRDQVTQQHAGVTEIEKDEYEEKTSQPKKRGPKKKRMTPARIVKLKQRRLKVSTKTTLHVKLYLAVF